MNKDKKLSQEIVIGGVYGQTITGTLFTYKVLEYKGVFKENKYYLVENIETNFKQVISQIELHDI